MALDVWCIVQRCHIRSALQHEQVRWRLFGPCGRERAAYAIADGKQLVGLASIIIVSTPPMAVSTAFEQTGATLAGEFCKQMPRRRGRMASVMRHRHAYLGTQKGGRSCGR